ncbi:MAG: hypothetical protein ACWGN7_00800 [Thermodesulfovibrionales bacterium]
MHKVSGLIIFLLGLAFGIAGTILLPSHLRPYLPEPLRGEETVVKGSVVTKQREGATLLLTVNTSQGAILATFEQKVNEVDLLVSPGDEIEFALKRYEPFITDPRLQRVVMGTRHPAAGQDISRPEAAAPETVPSSEEPSGVISGQQPASVPPESGQQEAK